MNIGKKLLQKHDCPLEIELVPKGAGWTHVNLATRGEQLFFIISNVLGHQFSTLVRALYFFSPKQNDYDNADDIIESKVGAFDIDSGVVVDIFEAELHPVPGVYKNIPHKAKFTWDEEGSYSTWLLEREPNENIDFVVKLHIEIRRGGDCKEYSFNFLYKDLCYAVAKAYTKALKEYGFYGYHFSTYHENIDVNHLLYLKAVALDCLEVKEWSTHPSGNGEVTKLEDELDLLLFEM